MYYTEHQSIYNWSFCTWWIIVNRYFWRNLITPQIFFNMILDVTNFVSTGMHLLVITIWSGWPVIGGMWNKKCLVKKVHDFQNMSVCWHHCQWKRYPSPRAFFQTSGIPWLQLCYLHCRVSPWTYPQIGRSGLWAIWFEVMKKLRITVCVGTSRLFQKNWTMQWIAL